MRNSLAAFVVLGAGLPWCQGCGADASLYPTHDAAVDVPIETGAVAVSGGFTICPTVVMELAPSTVRVGQAIAVSGHATAPDAAALTFMWKAASGTFADPAAAHTTFTCSQAGAITVTLSVSDGACVTDQMGSVFCIAIPDGGLTGAGGTSGGAGTSGGGGAGGGGGGTGTNTCPAAEPPSGGATCETCTTANCSLGATGTDGCCGLASTADQLLCEAAFACIAAHAATCTSMGDAQGCFCGTSGNDCFAIAGAANGPCVSAVVAAAKTASPPAIQGQFTSPASPLGRAVNLAACRGNFCSGDCAIP